MSRCIVAARASGKIVIDGVYTNLKDGFEKMGGQAETILTDSDGSFNSTLIKTYLNANKIRQIFTLGHASYAERPLEP